jgi:hypothetical protein
MANGIVLENKGKGHKDILVATCRGEVNGGDVEQAATAQACWRTLFPDKNRTRREIWYRSFKVPILGAGTIEKNDSQPKRRFPSLPSIGYVL